MSVPAVLRGDPFDVHAQLRAATRTTHERLHGLGPFVAIAEGRLSRKDYVPLLQSLHGYHGAIAVSARQGLLVGLSSSARRMALLENDLDDLGAARPAKSPLWSPPTQTALYGALYVAEGSALGGKGLARQLDYLFGDAPAGRSFFRGAGDAGAHWRSFLAALNRNNGEADMPQLLAGAQASFALFERCIAS